MRNRIFGAIGVAPPASHTIWLRCYGRYLTIENHGFAPKVGAAFTVSLWRQFEYWAGFI
jgi:hypothetical protein